MGKIPLNFNYMAIGDSIHHKLRLLLNDAELMKQHKCCLSWACFAMIHHGCWADLNEIIHARKQR